VFEPGATWTPGINLRELGLGVGAVRITRDRKNRPKFIDKNIEDSFRFLIVFFFKKRNLF
jgi:hypothetical protein